jgi:hypothetical protein
MTARFIGSDAHQFCPAHRPVRSGIAGLAFRDRSDKLLALIFNHSTHTIVPAGWQKTIGGLLRACRQDLEAELVAPSRSLKRLRIDP